MFSGPAVPVQFVHRWIPLLDKGSGTPILFAFQATGICRMVLVMQTCDLSEPDSMLT